MKKQGVYILTVLCMAFMFILPSAALGAGEKTYTFTGVTIAKPSSTEDVENAELTKDISISTSGEMNWKAAGITDLKNNNHCGNYPIGGGFEPEGSYIFMTTGSTNDNAVFSINMPTLKKGSRVTITYAKPIITNNGSTRRNENDPYAYFKIADRYISINGTDFDTWITESVVISSDTNTIDFCCDKWGTVAIQKIKIEEDVLAELHGLTVNASKYANLTVNGVRFYADASGHLNAGVFEKGDRVTISAQKEGYEDNEKSIMIGDRAETVNLMQKCEKDAAYYESDFGNKDGRLTLGRFRLRMPSKALTKFFGQATFGDKGWLMLTADGSGLLKIEKKPDGIYANDSYITSKDNMEFEVVIDQEKKVMSLVQNDTVYSIGSMDIDFSTLDTLSGENVTMDYVGVGYPDKNNVQITGPDTVSLVNGELPRIEYEIVSEYRVPDTFPVNYHTDNDKIGFFNFGTKRLYVNKSSDREITAPEKVVISADYNDITAEKEITVMPYARITDYSFSGTVLNLHDTAWLYPYLTSVKDEYGNELCDVITDRGGKCLKDFQSSDESVIKISADGQMTAVGCGKAVITANAFTGVNNIIHTEFTVCMSDIGGYARTSTVYEPNIFEDGHITGYKLITWGGAEAAEYIKETDIPAVTITDDGFLITASYWNDELEMLKSREVHPGDKAEISSGEKAVYLYSDGGFKKLTADDADTEMRGFEINPKLYTDSYIHYSVSPVYTFTDIGDVAGDGKTLDTVFGSGVYDISFKKADTWRGDIYVNGYMVGNNVDQADADRTVTEGSLYTAECIPVEDGEITVSMTDGSTVLDYVTVERSDTADAGKQRIFIIGDSLVCEYYGSFEQEVGGGRSGWGQQLGDFVNIPVTNLANSGQYAAGLYRTAFPGIIRHSKPGDILLIESGYNDRSYSTREEMTQCVKDMIAQCRAHSITPVIVTPNASRHDYKPSVVWSSCLRDIAEDTQCDIIDLSKESYDFLYSLYGDDSDNAVTMNYNLTAVGGDTLHSSYAGAYVWASVVAQGLKDLGYDFVNTDFKYTFTDTVGNKITARVK